MENKPHVLFCVMGESASGKDRLVSELCKKNDWNQLISYATRPQRPNEGATHIFVNEDMYEAMKSNNEVAAYTCINNYHYWSTVDQLYDSDFYIIDCGAETLKLYENAPHVGDVLLSNDTEKIVFNKE